MRIGTWLLFVTAVGFSVSTLSAQTNTSAGFDSDKDRASYAIGQGIGQQMKRQYLDLNLALVDQAMKDATAR